MVNDFKVESSLGLCNFIKCHHDLRIEIRAALWSQDNPIGSFHFNNFVPDFMLAKKWHINQSSVAFSNGKVSWIFLLQFCNPWEILPSPKKYSYLLSYMKLTKNKVLFLTFGTLVALVSILKMKYRGISKTVTA